MPELQTDKLFASAVETTKPEVGHINGKIPAWLKGTYMRVGPGKFDLDPNFTMNHWFDGFSILSKFTISPETETVEFEKKYLQSDAYKKAVAASRPVLTEYGTRAFTDPNKSLLSRIMSCCLPMELTDNAAINLFKLGSETFATGETCFIRKIHPENLSTGEKFDSNKCFGLNVACAHPITDSNGDTYTLGSSVLTGLKYNIVKIPKSSSGGNSAKELMKKSKIIASINSSWSGVMSYNHSFGLSKNWIVFIEQPYVMNIGKAALSYLKGGHTFSDWLEWRGGDACTNRFWLVEKESGKVTKVDFKAKVPFFFLHIINVYEDNGQLVIDLASYENSDSLKSMNLAKTRSGDCSQDSQATAHRYVIPLITDLKDVSENVDLVAVKSSATATRQGNSIILTPEILSQPGFEMPVINKNFTGRKYSYFYGSGAMGESYFSKCICKCGVKKSSSSLLWRESDYTVPGEPIFIPNPNAAGDAEDDGVIISAVTDARSDHSDFLLFLDAKTFTELGRAKFRQHIPLALHGLFLNESEAKS